jgi:putative transposase
VLATLPAAAQLQRRLNRALQGDLPQALRRRRQPLALDLTLVPYHGKPLHHRREIYRSQAKSGTSHFHAYATASVIRKGRRFTVALTTVGRDDPLPAVRQRLLREAARVGIRPRYLLLDRGFCSVDVIRYLQRARYAWLMPLVLRGRPTDHPKGPSGSRVFALCKRSCWGQYTMTNAAKRRACFRVCITCRNRRGERGRHGRQALVYAFGGPLRPSSYTWVKET